MSLITLADAKATLNDTSTLDDDELQLYVDAATYVVETERGETIATVTVTDQFDVSMAASLQLRRTPVQDLVSVVSADGTTWNVADLHLNMSTGQVTVVTGQLLDGFVDVTYTAGYDVVPANYMLAARHVVFDLWSATQRGAMDLSTASENEAAAFIARGYVVPRDVKELLGLTLPGIG